MTTARPRRKAISMRVQRDAALAQLGDALRKLGLVPVEVTILWELDHDPALGLRPVNDDGSDYEPAQHDVRYLVWRPKASDHKAKTFGRHGESDLSLRNGDLSRIAKAKRLEKDTAEFRSRILARPCGEPRKRKGTIKGGGFAKGHRPLRSRNSFEKRRSP